MKILLNSIALIGIAILAAKLIDPRTNALSDDAAFRMSCDAVQASLKSPSTAVFPGSSSAIFARGDDLTLVTSYVDSQNGFGATVRADWVVSVKKSGGRYSSANVVNFTQR